MQVYTTTHEGVLTVKVTGEINTITAPSLAGQVEDLSGVSRLIFDLGQVRYVSSAGLRLFLNCERLMMSGGGEMLITNCNDFVMETFSSVGYDRIMKISKQSFTK